MVGLCDKHCVVFGEQLVVLHNCTPSFEAGRGVRLVRHQSLDAAGPWRSC